MAQETSEAPEAVARLIAANEAACAALGERLRSNPPRLVVTCARGSSDHAATYAKYVIETTVGVITASTAPSVTSVYTHSPSFKDSLFVAISQSGKSPDLVESARRAKQSGALIVRIVNETYSPLAELADVCLPVHAGPERSVAATKSYIASLAAILQLVAHWSGDEALLKTIQDLPDQLSRAIVLDWSRAEALFAKVDDIFVVGRGVGFGIAQEAALKFKETSNMHAEAFSAAELMHGPLALIHENYPVFVFSQDDETRETVSDLVAVLREKKAIVYVAESGPDDPFRLPVIEGVHPLAAPITMIQTFYIMAEKIALARGLNPDEPQHLKKVTETR